SYHPEMKLEYGGGLVNRQKEYGSILSDVRISAIFTILGLFLVIGLYFRRLRAVSFVLTPLIMGVLWTLAIGFSIFGELTTVTVFIFAILLGLAIDFSIHLLSGYNHLRAEGMEPVDALVGCYSTTGRATVIGAFTTFVTFVVLSFAQFRGLSQFGQVASIGVICTLLAMLVVLPALILTVQHVLAHKPSAPGSTFLGLAPGSLFNEARVRRFAPLFLLAAAGFVALAMTQLPKVGFEDDFHDIGQIEWPWAEQEEEQSPAQAAEAEAAHRARVVVKHAIEARGEMEPETFEEPREQTSTGAKWTSAVGSAQSSTPTVLLFDDPEDARDVFRLMDERLENGELDTVRSLGSIHAFVPGTRQEQEERIVEIRRIDELLADEDLSVLDKKDRERVDELSVSLDADPVDVYDLPPWSKRLFRESGDAAHPPAEGEEIAFEYIVYVNSAVNAMNGVDARRYLTQLQDVREASGVDFRIGSQAYIYVAMLDEIKTDGVRMMGIALVVVFLILAFVFRHPFRGLVALTPLLLGALWMFGLAGWLGIRLDFFNVIILPVIIGIGVDDGVHFYHHYRDLGPGSVGAVMRKVGSAIVMTSVTSMIGFGGLTVTSHDGLQSIGYLAIAGIASTLVATLLVLPAILWLGEKYDIQWLVGGE
ncbi:MAG: efflux RND transporter permease subunit, partial [Persicimonas sp.]